MKRLSATEVRALDPYAFLAVLGKVIHPGGRHSTDRLLQWAAIQPGERVLDIGCGVGATAIRIAREADAEVVTADIAPLMHERTCATYVPPGSANVSARAGRHRATVLSGRQFRLRDSRSVTMFVSRPRAAAELARRLPAGWACWPPSSSWRSPPPMKRARCSSVRCARA